MAKLTIGDKTVTVDDSFRSLPPEQQQATVEEIARSLGIGAAPEQEMVGFGTRADREQDMPETPDVARERRIAQRMARGRENFGAGDVFLQDYTFGLRDEVAGAGSGLAGMLHGRDFSEGYEESQEADRRLREEYAEKNPITSTVAGLGGAVAGALPMVAAGATSLGAQMAQGAKAAAVQGGIVGAAEGDETGGRLQGAAIGASVGGAFGAAAPAVIAGAKAVAKPIANTIRSVRNPEAEAARHVDAARQRDLARGDGLDDAAYDAARSSGQPVTLMDRGGENTRALARAAANQSPEARAVMEDVVRPRFATQVERLDDVLKGESKLPAGDFLEQAEIAARKANRPAYNAAYAKGSGDVWDPKLERLLQSPAVEDAMKAAIRKYKNNSILEGYGGLNSRVTLDDAGNLLFRNEGGLEVRPDLRLWDLTKRELDRLGKTAARNGDDDARIYKGLAKQLTETLDNMGDMGKAYAKARQTAASFFGAENAYEAGLKYASSKGMGAREAVRGLSKLKPEERSLFKEGYIQAMRDSLGEMKLNRDATLTVMNSKADIERARVALGKAGADRLKAQLEVEATMDAGRKAFGNSTTARQLTELGLFSAAGSGIAGATTGVDPTNLTVGALAGAATKYGRGKINDRLMTEVGKLLASKDPKKVDALVKLASRSPKYLDAIQAIRAGLVSAGAIGATEAISQ